MGRSLRRSLGQISTELGFDLATVFEAAGDQYVIAATAEDEAMNDVVSRGSESGWFSRMSLCAVVEIGDAEAAEKIVKRLRKKAEESADAAGLVVKKVDGGFRIDASDSKSRFIPFETLELAVRDKHIVFAAGAKKRVNVDEDAFDGAESCSRTTAATPAPSTSSGSAAKRASGSTWGGSRGRTSRCTVSRSRARRCESSASR